MPGQSGLNFPTDVSSKSADYPEFPKLPEDFVRKFPELVKWQEDVETWLRRYTISRSRGVQ